MFYRFNAPIEMVSIMFLDSLHCYNVRLAFKKTESLPIKVGIALSVLWLSYGTGDWKVLFSTRQEQNILLFSKAVRLSLDTRVSFDGATGVRLATHFDKGPRWRTSWSYTTTLHRPSLYEALTRGITLLFSVKHQQLKESLVVYPGGGWSNFNDTSFANA